MRPRLIKGATLVVLAASMFAGGLAARDAVAKDAVTPAPTVTVTPAVTEAPWYTLPSCDEDAPDPTLTNPCVWEDEGLYWVMDGQGGGLDYLPCPTEDSGHCVWDAAERGNRNESVDSPQRYVVNV